MSQRTLHALTQQHTEGMVPIHCSCHAPVYALYTDVIPCACLSSTPSCLAGHPAWVGTVCPIELPSGDATDGKSSQHVRCLTKPTGLESPCTCHIAGDHIYDVGGPSSSNQFVRAESE